MNRIKKLDKGGMYGTAGGIKGIEYRIEERKRLREGIRTEIMSKRGRIR